MMEKEMIARGRMRGLPMDIDLFWQYEKLKAYVGDLMYGFDLLSRA